jgi:predicted RNA-binding protein with PIN domain
MAFQYLIDGYNLLYALPVMPPGTWQEKRAHLLAWLKQKRPQGNNAVTVIFDSRQGLGDRQTGPDLTVIFTAGETADDWISAHVRQTPNPRAMVVVSNDLGIRTMVRGTGARFLTASDFLKSSSLEKRDPGRSRQKPDNASEITDEFKEKWL